MGLSLSYQGHNFGEPADPFQLTGIYKYIYKPTTTKNVHKDYFLAIHVGLSSIPDLPYLRQLLEALLVLHPLTPLMPKV